MWHDAEYIDERVWRAWRNGMKYFAEDPKILKLWQAAVADGSYYGFSLDFTKDP